MNLPPARFCEISVSVIENRREALAALAHFVEDSPGLRYVSMHRDAADALEKIPRFSPDVVLINLNLAAGDGIACVRKLKRALPMTQILVLTDCKKSESVIPAIMAGANGYLLQPKLPGELREAIRDVQAGGSPMDSSVMSIILRWLQRSSPTGVMNKLSPKEKRVFEQLSQGHRYRDIATNLDISYATAHTHIRHIYRKLQVRSRTQAVTLGLREMMVENELVPKPFWQPAPAMARHWEPAQVSEHELEKFAPHPAEYKSITSIP